MTTFGDVLAARNGVRLVRHPILTFAGTWAAPGVGYPSDVVHGADPDLVYEVPVQGPWSFGPVPPGSVTAPSYEESVDIAVQWAIEWINGHTGTFGLWGYSQGAEAASRVLIEILSGSLSHRRQDLIGGGTFGNPMREKGHGAPGWGTQKGCGIAAANLAGTPADWFDYVNPGDLYSMKLDGQAGQDEEDVYSLAVKLQLGDPLKFIGDMVTVLGGGLLTDMTGILANPLMGGIAAIQASAAGLAFMGAGTGPHITYAETGAVNHAIGHLNTIASAVPARA